MPTPPSSRSSEVVAHIDGASRGNPGPAAYAVVMDNAQGVRLAAFSNSLGETTNNVAEYQALLAALDHALKHHHLRLKVLTDSELLARQIEGVYKVKHPDLKPLHAEARRMIARLEAFSIRHVPREENREADRLANRTLDAKEAEPGFQPPPTVSRPAPSKPLRTPATYQKGVLKPHQQLPLFEGEEVDLDIHRKQ
jgi:probable phosphoglycerate mutase